MKCCRPTCRLPTNARAVVAAGATVAQASPAHPAGMVERPATAPSREAPASVIAPDRCSRVFTPIPSLADLIRTASLRPEFLGAGPFGSRWGARAD